MNCTYAFNVPETKKYYLSISSNRSIAFFSLQYLVNKFRAVMVNYFKIKSISQSNVQGFDVLTFRGQKGTKIRRRKKLNY